MEVILKWLPFIVKKLVDLKLRNGYWQNIIQDIPKIH